jgi:3'(2'), 5'-bisphosphate nucleotidase
MNELEAAREAVARASRVCRTVQAKLEDVRAVLKDDKSPVTVADLASQAVVAHVLRSALGDVALVAEEDAGPARSSLPLQAALVDAVQSVWPGASASEILDAIDGGKAAGGASGTFWTLDPIDGTKGFLRGEQYAVSLALIEGGVPVLGVLGCPNLPDPSGSMFFATRGGGFWISELDAKAAPKKSARAPLSPDAELRVCESVEAAHSKHDDTKTIMTHLARPWTSVRLDSQAKYAVVASGQADLYLRMPTKKGYVERIWDHAAGALCAAEAGCVVSDIRGAPLDFGKGRGLEANLGVAVAPPGVHGAIIKAIAQLSLDTPR